MLTGILDYLGSINDLRKLQSITMNSLELTSTFAMQKTRLAEAASLREKKILLSSGMAS